MKRFALALLAISCTPFAWGEETPAASPEAAAPAPVPAPTENVVKVQVFPDSIELATARDRQSIVVQATYSDGITRDVTAESEVKIANPELAKYEAQTLYPVADGATEVSVTFAGQTINLPLAVKNAAVTPPISFKLDVMPVFMKAGCNSGSCHGAARGKDGFRLSLFGFDPDGDHFRLTREVNGRRINLALPEECLLIEKSIGKVPHTGGKRFEVGSELYQSLVAWLKAGVPTDPADLPTPVSMEILPRQAVLDGTGSKQKMTVRAKYSDGTDRDVTSLALFLSNNDTSAQIDDAGVVTAGERGEAFVMARFATFTVGSQVIVVPKGLAFEFPQIPENNYIDTLVHDKLKKLRITPSELCTDEVFLRRAYLDVIGIMPTREEYDRFMTSTEPDKRAKLIDELLERKEFAEVWVMKFAELLQIRSTQTVSYKAINLYYNWLQDKIANNIPMNEIVQELLGANGGTFKSPATNYYQLETDTLKVAENVAQVFMGMRIQCAQCHNHPFDRWTMDDYYSFAAFFAQIGRKGAEDPREVIVFNSGGGEVKHLVGSRAMPPKFLGGDIPDVKGKDRRVVLAEWLASPDNPFFARNLSNMIWAHFLGVGIIEPVDDVRISNPASNPELLDALAAKFTEYKYDFKSLVRDICNSRTYQLATQRNDSNKLDELNFSHGAIRRIRAEVLLDSITAVTETKNKFPGLPLGARAVQIADGVVSNYFLTTFGRASRETVCSCEVVMAPNLSQALHLLNGDTTSQRIPSGNVVGKLLEQKMTPEQVIEELYIRCFTRKPTEEERKSFETLLASSPDPKIVLEDTFWALLNSKEFMFNH